MFPVSKTHSQVCIILKKDNLYFKSLFMGGLVFLERWNFAVGVKVRIRYLWFRPFTLECEETGVIVVRKDQESRFR